MPELPEVETTRLYIEPYLQDQIILQIENEPSARYETELMIGRCVTKVYRRGKYIILSLDNNTEGIIHLGMTGGFRHHQSKHTRVIITTEVGTLYFQDARKFGRWTLVPSQNYQSLPTLHHMGPEPLSADFAIEPWFHMMSMPKKAKPWLLSQRPVAGLGNIYVDEALWQAKIHPEQRGIDKSAALHLHAAIIDILTRAIQAGGSTLSDKSYQKPDGQVGYFQFDHMVYDKAGQPCKRCGTIIEKYWLEGRGTHFCPNCQQIK